MQKLANLTGHSRMTEVQLKDILDKKHALYQLADRLNWDALIEGFGPYYKIVSSNESQACSSSKKSRNKSAANACQNRQACLY